MISILQGLKRVGKRRGNSNAAADSASVPQSDTGSAVIPSYSQWRGAAILTFSRYFIPTRTDATKKTGQEGMLVTSEVFILWHGKSGVVPVLVKQSGQLDLLKSSNFINGLN